MLTTAGNMLNDALSTYTYDAENGIATAPPGTCCLCQLTAGSETWNCLAVSRVPMRSREVVMAAAWGWEQMVHLGI